MIIARSDWATLVENEVHRVVVGHQLAQEDGQRIHESGKERSVRAKDEPTRWPVHGQGSQTFVLPHFEEWETQTR